jgi:hypothetical protein
VKDIKTIDDLIAEFGGPARFGEWLDIGQEAVSAFKWRGVSPGWHLRLRAELRRRGCDVNPAVFGLTQEAVGTFDAPIAPATPSSAAFYAAIAEAEAETKLFNAAMKASEAHRREAKQAAEKEKAEASAARADVCGDNDASNEKDVAHAC